MDDITTEAELRVLPGETTPAAAGKDRAALDVLHRQRLAASRYPSSHQRRGRLV